ncbi:MAG TPA: prolyl oligopeptidase family serine peptidase, partial [Actinomycetota bacterium]
MSEPRWVQRFTAPTIEQVVWAEGAPDRVAAVTTESGSDEAWSWDLASGDRVQASGGIIGAEEVHILPDGSGVVWWYDELGTERGRWLVTPFGGRSAEALLPELPDGWMMGISLTERAIAVGLASDEDYRVYVRVAGERAEVRYRHDRPAGVGSEWPQGRGGLSPDGSLLCIRHAERGDIDHPALRVLDASTGETVGDQAEPDVRIEAGAWSPVSGDPRLAITQESTGIERPAVWDPSSGERRDLELPELEGPVTAVGWTPDAARIVVHHDPGGGVQRLLALDPATTTVEELVAVEGTIHEAAYRPDGVLWYRTDSSVDPPGVRDVEGRSVLALPGDPPPGRRSRPLSWTNPSGDTIHGFLTTPDGTGPFPTIASIHGGPGWHHTDLWDPALQAFVDEGFAVLQTNYRGSTGRGRAFRDVLRGNIGFPESEDVVAGIDHAIATGIADPGAVFLEGWSWGGYLTTLLAGLHPERWRAACAGIPVGDYVAAHYECAPALRAWDVATMGGTPMDLPALYRERNPITYVDRVRAPMLLIAGEHDSRCPLGQVMVYS